MGDQNIPVATPTTDEWRFVRLPDAGWRWVYCDESGVERTSSRRFSGQASCMADAIRHGYNVMLRSLPENVRAAEGRPSGHGAASESVIPLEDSSARARMEAELAVWEEEMLGPAADDVASATDSDTLRPVAEQPASNLREPSTMPAPTVAAILEGSGAHAQEHSRPLHGTDWMKPPPARHGTGIAALSAGVALVIGLTAGYFLSDLYPSTTTFAQAPSPQPAVTYLRIDYELRKR